MSKISAVLSGRIEETKPDFLHDVTIFLNGEPGACLKEIEGSSKTREKDIRLIRAQCNKQQASLVKSLSEQRSKFLVTDVHSDNHQLHIKPLWINNSVRAMLNAKTINEAAERDDVFSIQPVHHGLLSEVDEYDHYRRFDGHHKSIPVGEKILASYRDFLCSGDDITWSVDLVEAPKLWRKGFRGKDVLAALIDSGVNYHHPDLKDRMWKSEKYPKHGMSFVEASDNDPNDDGRLDGHGTRCAGILAGDGSSGTSTGVAPEAEIMALRVGHVENQFWEAMEFAANNGAHIISMSHVWDDNNWPYDFGWRRCCETLLALGIVHVNSAGNWGREVCTTKRIPENTGTPANCPPPLRNENVSSDAGVSAVITCGAAKKNDEILEHSSTGPVAWSSAPYDDYPHVEGSTSGLIKPDICGPGESTRTCSYKFKNPKYKISNAGRYTYIRETSAAAPHVAGCLCLLMSACIASGEPIIPSRLQAAIESGAVRMGGQKKTVRKEDKYGAGRIDVLAAFEHGVAEGWWRDLNRPIHDVDS